MVGIQKGALEKVTINSYLVSAIPKKMIETQNSYPEMVIIIKFSNRLRSILASRHVQTNPDIMNSIKLHTRWIRQRSETRNQMEFKARGRREKF